MRQELLDAIRGPAPFRVFRSTIRQLGIEQSWYQFREQALTEIARSWLEEHTVKKYIGFVPIGVREYVKLHVKANPDENPTDLLARLRGCVSDALAGARCHCGARIWVVGSVSAGNGCFTCITGEAFPSEDYEIDEVLNARGELTARGFERP